MSPARCADDVLAAYTMFNVYFPKLIEIRLGKEAMGNASRKHVMMDVVIFTVGGTPGAIVRYAISSFCGGFD